MNKIKDFILRNLGETLIITGSIVSILSGVLVTYKDFTKGVELLIFPGIPMLVIATILLISNQANKKKTNS